MVQHIRYNDCFNEFPCSLHGSVSFHIHTPLVSIIYTWMLDTAPRHTLPATPTMGRVPIIISHLAGQEFLGVLSEFNGYDVLMRLPFSTLVHAVLCSVLAISGQQSINCISQSANRFQTVLQSDWSILVARCNKTLQECCKVLYMQVSYSNTPGWLVNTCHTHITPTISHADKSISKYKLHLEFLCRCNVGLRVYKCQGSWDDARIAVSANNHGSLSRVETRSRRVGR